MAVFAVELADHLVFFATCGAHRVLQPDHREECPKLFVAMWIVRLVNPLHGPLGEFDMRLREALESQLETLASNEFFDPRLAVIPWGFPSLLLCSQNGCKGFHDLFRYDVTLMDSNGFTISLAIARVAFTEALGFVSHPVDFLALARTVKRGRASRAGMWTWTPTTGCAYVTGHVQ